MQECQACDGDTLKKVKKKTKKLCHCQSCFFGYLLVGSEEIFGSDKKLLYLKYDGIMTTF